MGKKSEQEKMKTQPELSGGAEARIEIQDFHFPAYNEIPDVGLYLKQVVRYLNDTLNPYFDIAITDTMISNYVKLHLVPGAVKKLYYRDHIALFLFIILSKSMVSLDHIQTLLKLQQEQYETKDAYIRFVTAFEKILRNIYGAEKEPLSEPEDSYQKLVKNVIIGIVQKYYIETCFRELDRIDG